MLTFDRVSYAYAGGKPVLQDLSFSIHEGERVGLIGANGAGKSTLMKAALGLIDVQGQITVDALPLNKQNLPAVRKTLGYVLQDSDNQMFMPTVWEDMLFGPLNYGLSRQEAEELAQNALDQLHISFLKQRHNHRLSGGEKRMAAIATILTMQPKAILMDEPSAALDPKNRRSLIHTLNDLPVTLLIASHDLDFILETCDRVLLLSQGRLIADGSALPLLQNQKLLEENNLELPFCMAGLPQRCKG